MKQKYYVRGGMVGTDLDLPDGFVFGLSYEEKKGVVTVGGPTAMKEKILETVRGVFECSFGIGHDRGRRFSVVAKRVSVRTWEKGLEMLKGQFSVVPTEHFRRLMR